MYMDIYFSQVTSFISDDVLDGHNNSRSTIWRWFTALNDLERLLVELFDSCFSSELFIDNETMGNNWRRRFEEPNGHIWCESKKGSFWTDRDLEFIVLWTPFCTWWRQLCKLSTAALTSSVIFTFLLQMKFALNFISRGNRQLQM